jgi:hypothetical protein
MASSTNSQAAVIYGPPASLPIVPKPAVELTIFSAPTVPSSCGGAGPVVGSFGKCRNTSLSPLPMPGFPSYTPGGQEIQQPQTPCFIPEGGG